MIKLQLLLRQAGTAPELDPALRARLEAHGMDITGTGCATVSVQLSEAQFDALFGTPPAHASGFAAEPLAPGALAVPPDLAQAIRLITLAPRHSATNHTVR